MTDYAKATAPDEVCDHIAADLRATADAIETRVRELQAQATALTNAATNIERDARQYRQWQPTPTPSVEEPLLGLATTAELITELVARLDTHRFYVTEGGVEHEGHPERPVREVCNDAHEALILLGGCGDPRVLDYRTVDS